MSQIISIYYPESSIDSKSKAILAAKASLAKKAEGVTILELNSLTTIADYFVICSASNTPQIKSIVENIEKVLMEAGFRPLGIEGLAYACWVLLDYGDIIVHVFEENTRQYYNLEKLWLDAPRINVEDENKNPMGWKDKREVSK